MTQGKAAQLKKSSNKTIIWKFFQSGDVSRLRKSPTDSTLKLNSFTYEKNFSWVKSCVSYWSFKGIKYY